MGLTGGGRISPIRLAVFAQYQRVTNRQTKMLHSWIVVARRVCIALVM